MNLIGYDAMAVGNHEFDNPQRTASAGKMGEVPVPLRQYLPEKHRRASVCRGRCSNAAG
jgi:hypothetical protein